MFKPGRYLTELRKRKPLLHHITNYVTMNFLANGTLAAGGSPMMVMHKEEAAEGARVADGLVLNIGTLDLDTVESMIIAGIEAKKKGIPVVFDPVGVGLSKLRRGVVERILTEVKPDAIVGNASEIAFLATEQWDGKGADTGEVPQDVGLLACEAAKKLDTLIVLTGKKDSVSDGRMIATAEHGDEWLPLVTGTGCFATSMVALFLAHGNGEESLERAMSAICMLGIAAEEARKSAVGPGTFQAALLDQLYLIDEETLNQRTKIKLEEMRESSGANQS